MNTRTRKPIGKPIGKVVSSNSHIDYVCQVYGPGEFESPPPPADYAFGSFVVIGMEGAQVPGDKLIGVIYNTLLVNPDYGSLGPRLSSRQDLEIFSPDYLSETATLIGIMVLGGFDADGSAHQGVPGPASAINASVYKLSEDEIRAFHRNAQGRLQLHYAPLLMNQGNPLISPLFINIVDQLSTLFPDQQQQLTVMRNNLAWKNIVRPAG